jgi:transposase
VKRERFDWLAGNPFYTNRFGYYVGRRCRSSSIKAVTKELHLDWKTVKALEKQYMGEQYRRVGTPGPKVIGIDEVLIRKDHTYLSAFCTGRDVWAIMGLSVSVLGAEVF